MSDFYCSKCQVETVSWRGNVCPKCMSKEQRWLPEDEELLNKVKNTPMILADNGETIDIRASRLERERLVAKFTAQKIYDEGNKPCPHSYLRPPGDFTIRLKRECSTCWNKELVEEIEES